LVSTTAQAAQSSIVAASWLRVLFAINPNSPKADQSATPMSLAAEAMHQEMKISILSRKQ
jgi:hypothetical protein